MLKYIVLLALIALVAIAFGSDRIEQFQSCVKACRGEKNTFRFCTKFCKPPKSAEVSKPKPAAKADKKKKRDPHAERVLKEILGDDYAVESDADPKPSLDTLTPQSKELWRKYKSVLLDFFRQGNPNALPGLQLVPNPFPADWDQDSNVLNHLCDTIPHWAPAYEPSRNLLSVQYGDWLLNLKIPNEKAAKTNFREIDNKLRDAEDRINNAEMQCMDRYDMRYGTRRPGYGEPESFANYTARFCLSLYREQANYDVLLAEYESMQYDTFGEHFALKRAIAKFSTEGRKGPYKFLSLGSMARFVESAKEQRTNSFEIKITSKTKVTTEKTFTTSIGLSYTMQNNPFSSSSTPASTLQDVPPEGETPPPTETPTETPTTPTETPTTPSTPSEGGVKPFMSIGINYSSTKYEFKTSTEELQLIVGAAGYKVFPVMPDRTWFSPEVFDKYKKNALKRPKNYFGIDGTMPMYPKMLIVVAGPRLTMLVSKEDASKMEKTSELKANIEVAGFKFDFAKNSKMTKTTEANNLFKITIEGNSYEPQVLAVDNEILADVKLPGMTL